MGDKRCPLVSIALSALNSAPTLDLAVRSILTQSYDNWELLLVDDGSTDDTLERMRSYRDPRIRILADGDSLGLASRLNQAIDAAGGSLFARMDADDIAYPNRLAKQVRYLIEHPEIDLLATGALVVDGALRPRGLFPRSGDVHEEICAHPTSGFYFVHPTWMGRVEWFRKHRYRGALSKAEDQELLLRTYRESRFARLPEVLLGYRMTRVPLKKNLQSRWIYSGVLWRGFMHYREPLTALRAVAAQALKMAYETLVIGTGLQTIILGHRITPLPEGETDRWAQVVETLGVQR